MTRKLFKESAEWGLSVNCNKTKYIMCVGEEASDLEIDKSFSLKSCEKYNYLGTTIDGLK